MVSARSSPVAPDPCRDFSMEFMLSEALPIYSGGLGNVAGDQLKAASDLGYRWSAWDCSTARLFSAGNRQGRSATSPFPVQRSRAIAHHAVAPGERRVVAAGDRLARLSVWLRAWQVQVGRVKLYLLDSNDIANLPAHRGITSELYGGGPELRLNQELVLGIGGWRLLNALGIKPEVCHLNEGHAAFAVLERARTFMEETGQPFEVALAPHERGISLPPTRQWPPVLTVSLLPSSNNTSVVMPREARHLASRFAGPWADRIQTTPLKPLTWPTWPCEGAERLMG